MKKLVIVFVLLTVFSKSTVSQVFEVVDSFRTAPSQLLIYLNEDSIYSSYGSSLSLRNKENNIIWQNNTGTGLACLHDHNQAFAIDITPDDGLVSLVDINESCTFPRNRVFKASLSSAWHYDFAPYQGAGGGVFVKDDTIHVLASLSSSLLPNNQNGFVKYRFDTLGNLIDSIVRILDYGFSKMQRYSEDSVIFILDNRNNAVRYSFAVADFNFDTFRIICELPDLSIRTYRLQNDSIYFIGQSSVDFYPNSSSTKDGIGVVHLNGQGLIIRTTNDSLEGFIRHYNIIKIDSFYMVTGHSSLVSSINVFDENLNFRMRFEVDYLYLEGGAYEHLVLVNDSTLMYLTSSGRAVYLRWDWSQMPPLPEDTIPGDTTKIFVPKLNKQTQTTLFPNPATTHFTLQNTQNIQHIQVFDLRGALVLEQNVQSTAHQVQLSEAGTYIIHIHLQDGSTERQKVVKMKE
jgi:hypothetical protein